ncbi:hypothetical protein M3A74_07825 [Corynebacterium appendicis]|uniref:hypothetical protein n=1 Tax=Corynebacterium appendicis TaxID=163202 RepID=UPI00223BA7A2|nr:hypothetical protein [Corynebacterium appendicis]MCT1684711.1 hypothetical protein [Corynebacterium appendicis]
MFKTYVEACLEGDAYLDEVDNWVDAWHDDAPGSENLSLEELLGFTAEEYARWARNGAALQEILENRRSQRQAI